MFFSLFTEIHSGYEAIDKTVPLRVDAGQVSDFFFFLNVVAVFSSVSGLVLVVPLVEVVVEEHYAS